MRDPLTFDANCQEVLEETVGALTREGFTVVRSFDLQGTKNGLAHTSGSHVVSEASLAQYVVLLVYGTAAEPLPVIVSGCCGCTEVCVPYDADAHVDPGLSEKIIEILAGLQVRGWRSFPNAQSHE